MTDYHIQPSQVSGTTSVPTSKSHTMRAIIFASMANGTSHISHYLRSPDIQAMIVACRQLGAVIHQEDTLLRIKGVNGQPHPITEIIEAGNSGQVLRFITALAALQENETLITGDHSIQTNRPMQALIDGLTQLGAFVVSTKSDGYAPITVKGPVTSQLKNEIYVDGQVSQAISGLLMLSIFLPGETHIHVRNTTATAWVQVTLDWLKRLGITVPHENYQHYSVRGRNQIAAFDYRVAGDFSSMAFPLAAALITRSEITIEGIDMNDVQGDKQIIDVFIQMGAQIEIDDTAKCVILKETHSLHGCTVNINNCIDAVCILAVVACFAEGTTQITGAAMARKKECNRLAAITAELKKMGANIHETNDGLLIEGTSLHGAELETYQDHRMVMALSVAALGAKGESLIKNSDCVSKSYPNFDVKMGELGAKIKKVS